MCAETIFITGQEGAHEDYPTNSGTSGFSSGCLGQQKDHLETRSKQEIITTKRVVDLLRYNSATGQFYWKHARPPNKAGKRAGTLHSLGYWVITIDRRPCYAHRLAWLCVYGEWPPGPLDHINGDKRDNRIVNLRLTTARKNQQNLKKHREGKLVGCTYNKLQNRWQARIHVQGKLTSLGYFSTEEEAHQAYVRACGELIQ